MSTQSREPSHRSGTVVAAFDFDGTMTRRDTMVPFLASVAGRSRLRSALAVESARLLRAGRPRDRDQLKLGLIRRLLTGHPVEEYSMAGQRYAQLLPRQFRAATLEVLHWHQRQGHRVLLVSAGLGTYLRPLGTALGVHGVISVELLERDGTLTGETRGPNVRGPEKATRMRAWLTEQGLGEAELWAYGDSPGDVELLAMADHPVWVGRRGARVARRARGSGVRHLR